MVIWESIIMPRLQKGLVERMQSEDISIPSKALPYIRGYKGKTFVIKYGGSIMEDENFREAFMDDIAVMRDSGINIVIVHGGGPEISRWLKITGIESRFVCGLRFTDEKVMNIVEMVLSGRINKDIAAGLSRKGINAVGISGRDGRLIQAKKKYIYKNNEKLDIGFVGDIVSINKGFLGNFIENGQVPVISPIGSDDHGNKYNINADYAAAAISSELKADKLIIITDVAGVYLDINDSSTLLPTISTDEIKEYIQNGVITGGMIPKMECCINAIEKGTKNVHLVDGNKEHGIISQVILNSGTKIYLKGGNSKCQKAI